jgi:hypothetical protein
MGSKTRWSTPTGRRLDDYTDYRGLGGAEGCMEIASRQHLRHAGGRQAGQIRATGRIASDRPRRIRSWEGLPITV